MSFHMGTTPPFPIPKPVLEEYTCPYCGSRMINSGAPIWEDYCTNKICTGQRDAMFTALRQAREKKLEEKKRTVYYLKSIMTLLKQDELKVEHGPTLYTEVLGDDIEWLESYIEQKEKEIESSNLR